MDAEQGNPVHGASMGTTPGASPSGGEAVERTPWLKRPSSFLLLFPVLGCGVVVGFLVATGSWQAALRRGLREWTYGILVTSMACAAFTGHVFFGERVGGGGPSRGTAAARVFQLELAVLSLCVGVALALFPDANGLEASLVASAWACFLGFCGLRHLADRGG